MKLFMPTVKPTKEDKLTLVDYVSIIYFLIKAEKTQVVYIDLIFISIYQFKCWINIQILFQITVN